ncbi:MAG: helix-turn-helix domain-containing protein [Microthrixaceae bacterium]|nr:helix-turn-helix domain-containing protein [Microthrixaceae bacterium]
MEEEPEKLEKMTSQVVGQNLARIRAASGMPVRVLAASLAENGMKMSGSGITEMEKGRRGVSVDQLTALAAALGVSPITLLTPLDNPEHPDPEAETILSGTSYERAEDMYDWLRGEKSLTWDQMDGWEREGWRRRAAPKWAWKKD